MHKHCKPLHFSLCLEFKNLVFYKQSTYYFEQKLTTPHYQKTMLYNQTNALLNKNTFFLQCGSYKAKLISEKFSCIEEKTFDKLTYNCGGQKKSILYVLNTSTKKRYFYIVCVKMCCFVKKKHHGHHSKRMQTCESNITRIQQNIEFIVAL